MHRAPLLFILASLKNERIIPFCVLLSWWHPHRRHQHNLLQPTSCKGLAGVQGLHLVLALPGFARLASSLAGTCSKQQLLKPVGWFQPSIILYKSRVTGHGCLVCFSLARVLNCLKWIYSSLRDPCTLTPADEDYGFVEGGNLEFSLSETEGISL